MAKRLTRAEALPEDGLRVIVKLREEPGSPIGLSRAAARAQRRAAIAARQQGVLDGLAARDFRLRGRYRNTAGFSGWAGRDAIDALRAHPDVEVVYLLLFNEGVTHELAVEAGPAFRF